MRRRRFIQAALAILAAPAALFRRQPPPEELAAKAMSHAFSNPSVPWFTLDIGSEPALAGYVMGRSLGKTGMQQAYISARMYSDLTDKLGGPPPDWIRRTERLTEPPA